MSQDDLSVANAAGSTVRADINSNLQALGTRMSGGSAPGTTYARMIWVDTTTGVVKRRNAANSGWLIESTDDETRFVSRSSNVILDASDIGKWFRATSNFTQTLDAVATIGDGWWCGYRIESGVTITFDPNASENINGATTLAVTGPASLIIACDGAALYTFGIEQPASDTVAGKIEIAVQSEQETGTDTTRAVTPGRQHFHPSAAKFSLKCDAIGGTLSSYNVASITDVGSGKLRVTLTTGFSSANWTCLVSMQAQTALSPMVDNSAATPQDTGTVDLLIVNTSNTATDPAYWHVAGFGDF